MFHFGTNLIYMQTKYKAICFDWSGVVFFYSASYAEIFHTLFQIGPKDFFPVYYQYNHLLNRASSNKHSYWEDVLREFGLEDKLDYFLDYIDNLPMGDFNHELVKLLKELKEKGYKLGLLSNHTESGARDARKLGVDEMFDVTCFSAEIGYVKPQAEAFLTLADKLEVDISEMVFVDDSKKSLENGEDIGYFPILFTTTKELKRLFKELNIV